MVLLVGTTDMFFFDHHHHLFFYQQQWNFSPCSIPTYCQLIHPAMVSTAACVSISRLICTKATSPHRSMHCNNIGYMSVAPSYHTSNVNNEWPIYHQPRSQSIDDQLFNQFLKMGGSSSAATS
jgi:hypothetical protein